MSTAGKGNSNLSAARVNKNDEFYTRLSDIEEEIQNYSKHLAGKIVYCPCDDPTWSKFWEYFKTKYAELRLAKLVSTHYVASGTSYKREYDGTTEVDTPLTGDGDFRSEECKAILDEADIVITNPPFSLFREFLALLEQKKKQFLIIGNNNAITYKECFKLIKENKMWLGVSPRSMCFTTDTNDSVQVNACWFTNLTHAKRNQSLDLYKNYSAQEYPRYDNYDAIEVCKVKEIPQGYTGMMGVPITFLDKYCPDQFEIIRFRKGDDNKDLSINGEFPYFRIIIKYKNPSIVQEDV